MKINNRKFTLSIVIFLIILGVGIAYFFLFVKRGIAIPCVFHEITGYYCPGCGITRCFTSILSLQFYQAFRYNMLIFCFLPFAMLYGIATYICWVTDRKIKKIPNYIWNILLIITILFGVMRNTVFFSVLAPTIIT